MTDTTLPAPPPAPPDNEHHDLAVMLRQVAFLNDVQNNRMKGMTHHEAIGAAIRSWADSQG